MRILVFSTSIGHGHNQVARAIQSEAAERGHSATVIDVLDFVSPFLSKVVLEGYMRILRYTPHIYGRLYEYSEESFGDEYSSIVNNVLCGGFQRLLEREQPSAIVCTHSFAVGLLTALKQRLQLDLPIYTVITDFAVHPSWIQKGVDRYITANSRMAPLMSALNVDADLIRPLGIPLRRQFSVAVDKQTARERIGIADAPTVLVMGGGLGLGLSLELIRSLISALPEHQILVPAGQNRVLQREIGHHALPESVKVLSYVDNMWDYMSASDLLVTKPGGVTCSEALCKGLPMALVSPIPGQENRNAIFLTDQLAAILLDETNTVNRLSDLLSDDERLAAMSRFAARLGRPSASEDLLKLIESEQT
ncbi:MAG TPA: glycosyltransferase [Bacillota bacterium]|nr:glycosyltransferase [Bacillota bacterium]